jgi:formamidopyrimidine-DNA glycosylase
MSLKAQFILHIAATPTAPAAQLAFLDARRLSRIRLCSSPKTEPPISNLGFDPILSMPNLDDYAKSVRKRTCTIKALLLNQYFNAGVGNWIAGVYFSSTISIRLSRLSGTDEILYQARVHPEERANVLTDTQLMDLHSKTVNICRKAIEVNADPSRFPKDWLFKHRWVRPG